MLLVHYREDEKYVGIRSQLVNQVIEVTLPRILGFPSRKGDAIYEVVNPIRTILAINISILPGENSNDTTVDMILDTSHLPTIQSRLRYREINRRS
ncbi:hypothetical protein K445DRAFT_316909 [Daldinia sp. EC12]|nr:hypothetical protein K445DRAFT_316909 [Daldinia sp. EC12]